MYVTYSDLFQCIIALCAFGTMLITLIALFLGKRK